MTNRLDMNVLMKKKNEKSLVGMAFLKTSSVGVIFIRVFV